MAQYPPNATAGTQELRKVNINTVALKTLKEVFGYQTFRNPQQQIVSDVLNNKDVLTIMPTGGGKSLCYQLPAVIQKGLTLVISPLIALMKDQVDALDVMGIPAGFLNSTQDLKTQREIAERAIQNKLKLLYVAPERLTNHNFLKVLKQTKISLFAIDEAHCVSQWGHDFRPDYLQIKGFIEQFPQANRIALTATADRTTRKDIVGKLGLRHPARYIEPFNRPNIHYKIDIAGRKTKDKICRFIKANYFEQSGIIYVQSRRKSEEYAEWLQEKGLRAVSYHAGMEQEEREHNQNMFAQGQAHIVVATIAFGMGIDKPDIRFVIHWGLPRNIESYYQETGRAGRDGEDSIAWMLYSLADIVTNQHFIEKSDANVEFKRIQRDKLNRILALCETINCRRQSILNYFDDTSKVACKNCDNCQNPPSSWDGTIPVKKALSAIYRTRQRYGSQYNIDLLLGLATDKIKKNQHDSLPTFGAGTELDEKQWKSVIRQMLINNLILSDSNQYGALKITPEGLQFLTGDATIRLRKDNSIKLKRTSRQIPDKFEDGFDGELYEKLRTLRNDIAAEIGKPPYVVFSNKTLEELSLYTPTTMNDLIRINGIGEYKAEVYGRRVLETIQKHFPEDSPAKADEKSTPGNFSTLVSADSKQSSRAHAKWTEREEKQLIAEYTGGTSINEIASKLQRKPSAIRNRVLKLVRIGKLD